ncbi:MAG TPA: type III-B CRISPR module RAMP protein Cmr6 [Patescibacteria group bacterium]|nr:type III-B CRISPR module RAMP protein Cmr6 [Patescibacteria group bacterium]
MHTRGALTFWDVFPKPPTSGPHKDALAVEIMTPHYGDYYQAKRSAAYPSGVTPHDAGQPNPIPFLAVPAGSRFDFYIICDQSYLSESLRQNWKSLLGRIFTHAFDWLGFGAKTAVGYGAMKRDEAREEEYRKEREERARQAAEAAEAKRKEGERQARLAVLDPLEREIEELLSGRPDKNQSELSYLINAVKQGRWSGDAKCRVAEKLRNMMRQGRLWTEKSQAKKPEKDWNYQNTLLVMSWLSGE